jgi:hypothetical protein
LLFTHGAIIYHKYTGDIQRVRHVHIFRKVEELVLDYSCESVIKDVNMCNVYDLDEAKFNKIIDFLDAKIIVWLDKIKTENGILELINNPCDTQLRDIKNGYLVDYIKLNFPNIDLTRILAN